MSSKNKKPTSKKETNLEDLRAPWIQKNTGFIVITVLSIGMMILVAAQIIMGSGDWGRGLLWGFLFGGSIWLVFFGMNWFHSLFRSKTNQDEKPKEK
jgi:hypothetical protein